MIVDFSNCELSDRDLQYAGRAGEKRGIIYNNEHWFLKFPKNTLGMKKTGTLSYVTSPLSEFIGSHIYQILGYEVHETILGICFDGKRNKVVCACKDFVSDSKNELLIPYTALRNDTNEVVMNRNNDNIVSASNLNEIIFQLENNTVLSKIVDAKSRFWDVVVIDYLINNNDRNEDNWGVIKNVKDNSYKLAPIYDCGNCFYSKTDDERISLIMLDEKKMTDSAINCITAYEDDGGNNIHFLDLLNSNNKDLLNSIEKVLGILKNKKIEIINFINSISNEYCNVKITSDLRKKYYLKTLELRINKLKDNLNNPSRL